MTALNLGILSSSRGSLLAPIVTAISNQQLTANIKLVISNKPQAGVLQQAEHFGLPQQYLAAENLGRADYDALIHEQLIQHNVNFVVLLGYMKILSQQFVKNWAHKIINVHPSLLPKHAGLADLQVHKAVLAAKETISGCSVHYVTAEVDAGPIILQKQCPVVANDSPESLKNKVQALEKLAIVEALQLISEENPNL